MPGAATCITNSKKAEAAENSDCTSDHAARIASITAMIAPAPGISFSASCVAIQVIAATPIAGSIAGRFSVNRPIMLVASAASISTQFGGRLISS